MSSVQDANLPLTQFSAAEWVRRVPEPDRDAVDEQGYPIYLDESDGIPLETNWHVLQMHLLIDSIDAHRRGLQNYYCGGNMFIYFSATQARNKDYRGPDFFLVNNVSREPLRKYWVVWRENFRFPDLVIELMSPSTREMDLTSKFRIYERTFSTREYVAYDPNKNELLAWRKVDGVFQALVPDENGRVFLEEAGLYFGPWKGPYHDFDKIWLRFFDGDGNLVLLEGESEARRANAEQERANAESERADAEAARADALAAEVARLKALLANPS